MESRTYFLNHLTAHRTSLLCGDVAVITLLKIYANFGGRFHLEFIHSGSCFGNKILVSHDQFTPSRRVAILNLYDYEAGGGSLLLSFCRGSVIIMTQL